MKNEDIIKIIQEDEWMMRILKNVQILKLNDWWIGAGFVRSKIWDVLHQYRNRTPIPDIDVIYFNKNDFLESESRLESTKAEKFYEMQLKKVQPDINWSVTNQARMHFFHNDSSYKTSEEALGQWVETATCIGVKLDGKTVVLAAPHGIHDLVNLILHPTSLTKKGLEIFNQRIKNKKWLTKWPRLKIEN